MKKRIIAMLMAIVMLVGNVPVQAFATEAEPQETLACVTEDCTYGAGHTGECSTFVACGKNGCTYAANHEGNCSTHVAPEEPKAEAAADAAVYVTVSNRGELGMAYEEVTVSDINRDGKLSVDEALYAAHTVHGKGYASENGTVTKLWDEETSNVSFFLNHAPLSTDVSVDTVSGGDYLVASVDQDAVNDYDKYSRFDVMEKSVSAGSEFTLTLTDDAGNALAGMEIGLSNGNGSTTMTGLTTDVNGAVTLTLDQEGMYCVTAKGTVVESSIDVNTMEITSIETPIIAPVCIVKVTGNAVQQPAQIITEEVTVQVPASATIAEDPDAGVATVAETELTVSGSTIDIEDKDLSAYVVTTLTINGATVTSAIQNDTTINVVLAEGTDPAASLSVGFAGTPKGGYLVTKNNTGTLSDGTGTITVTVAAMAAGQPRGQATYTINFTVPMGTAYTVTPPTGEGFIFTGKDSVYEGKDYNFSISVNEGYNGSNMVVKVNDETIDGTDGNYTVSAVSQNLEITVEGIVAKERCTVTLTEGEGYTISSDDIPYKGEDYTFSVAVDAVNYKADTLQVLLDGKPMIGENGVYTIPALASDHEVTVTVDKKAEFTVNWNELAGVTITGEKTVLETDSYTFRVAVDNAYDASGMKILVNDQEVTLQEDGSYTIDSVDADIAITVEGVEAKVIYTVSLTEGENYTISGQTTSYAGEPYTFTVTVDDAIYFADQIQVKVNGTEVELKEDGTYTFEALDGDKTVTVENVVERKLFHITKPEVDGVTFTGEDSVREGKPYTFSIAVASTHLSTDMVVEVNGEKVSLENGSHTVEAAAGDMEITVEGVRAKEEYTVTKNAPEGVTIGGAETVLETDPYSFTVTVAEGYDDSNLAVAVVVGEEPVDVSNGYSIASVTGNVTITVTGVEKKQLCNITLPSGKGYTVTGAPTAYAGDSYTFTVSVAAGYVSTNMLVTANGDIVPGNNGSYTITVEGDTEIAVTGVEREPLPEKELTVIDNVIDITDKTVYSLSSYYAKAVNIAVSGATVKKAYEDNTTIYILLPSNTADDAQISVTFGTSVNKCSMSGTTGSLTLAEGDGVLSMTLKGQYSNFSNLSSTATYNLIFIREAAVTEVPVRIQETDSAEMYRGKSITFDLDPWFTGEESYYLVESTGNTPVERYYTFNPDTDGTYTLLFGAANAVGECPEHVTVTVTVKDVESGVYILHTSGNGSMDSVQFQDAGGNPIEGLAASYDAATRTINVLLPKNYDVSGTVKAVFTMMQNASGYPFLSTVTETTGNRPYNSRFTEKAITLTGGAAQFTFYYYNTSTNAVDNGGQTEFTISLKMKNDLPVLAEGVSATAEATITAGKNYTLDLSPLFTDVDGDALTYLVSINGADTVEADTAYSYTTDTAGTYTLVFTANDGKGTSTATYTVTLTVEDADTTYAMTANLPEGLNPKFYVCSGYGEDGLDQLGAEVETVAGEAANGTVAYTLNYPTNASSISVRSEGWGGMAFAAEENAAVTLRQVQMNVVDYDNKAAESTNTVTYDGHTAASGTNGWLLVTGQEYTYTAAPKDTATLETASTTEKLEAGEGIHQQQLMLGIKNPITITVTTGATARLYNYDTNKYYYATEFEPKIIADNGDGTTTYSFVGSGSCLIYRVSMEGKVTKAGYFGWNQRSVNAVYDADDVASSYRLDDYSGTNSANSGMTEDSVVLNVNGQNHLSMNVGDSRTLKAYRIWEIIKISYQNYIITPNFTFNILSGSDVVSLTEKDSPSVGEGDWMTLTALKEGTAVIEVTYGAMEIAGGSYDGIYGASDPARTGLVVVQVGGNDASVNFGIDSFASRGKSYSDHIAYNSSAKRAWDAEFDTLYFTGSSGLLKLSPTAASAIKEVAVSHDKGGSWTQLTAQEGVYTAPIVSGNNILRITTEAGVAYQVVRGDRITVQISEVGDSSDGDGKIEPGETARITLKGLHMPIPKMAGNYNPGFGGNSDGYSSVHLNYTANGQAVHGPGTQYTFINDANYLDIAIPTDIQTDKLTLTDGYIGVGVVGLTQFDVGGDSHRNIPDGGCGTRESKTTFHTRSILPEITIPLEGVEVPVSVTGVSLDKTELTLNVNDTETLIAKVTPENADNQNVEWKVDPLSVVGVDNGKITARTPGTATVTVTTEDGGFSATCKVIVKQPVESVKVTPESSEVEAGKTVQLTAQVEPENATDKTVTWTSSDETVATVDETGVVTGVKTGTATITATAGEVSATSTVQVTEAEKSVTVAFTAQANGEFLVPPQLEMTVSANTAESYGYNDQTNQTTQVSAMDVLVAAHVAKFGESFTFDTSRNYLVVEGNFITAMFGSNNGGNVCMLVNGIQPGTAEYRLGVEQAVIADGDLVEFFIYQNAKYTDKYVWLEMPDGTNLDGQTVYGGKSTTVIVKGRSPYSYGYEGDAGNTVISGAAIYMVDIQTGTLTSLDVTTGADGSASIKVPSSYVGETVYLAAKGTEMAMTLAKVKIERAPISTACNLASLEIAVGGNTVADAAVKPLTPTFTGARTEYTTDILDYESDKNNRFVWVKVSAPEGTTVTAKCANSDIATLVSGEWVVLQEKGGYFWAPTYSGPLQTGAYNEVQITVSKEGEDDKVYIVTIPMQPDIANRSLKWKTDLDDAVYITKNAQDASLTVEAQYQNRPLENEDVVTYQWYSNTAASTEGSIAIEGATEAVYQPDVTGLGTSYYYAVASCKDLESITSNIIAVTVTDEAAPTSVRIVCDHPYTVPDDWTKALGGVDYIAKAGDTLQLKAVDENGKETPVVWLNTSLNGGTLDRETGIYTISNTSYSYVQVASLYDTTIKSEEKAIVVKDYSINQYNKTPSVTLSSDGQSFPNISTQGGIESYTLWKYTLSADNIAQLDTDLEKKPPNLKFIAMRPGTIQATLDLDLNGDGVADGNGHTDTATMSINGIAVEDAEGQLTKTYLEISTAEPNPTAQLTAISSTEDPVFTWSSNDETVATVDEKGVVTAQSVGSTIISVTDGTYTGGIKLVVTSADTPYFEQIDFVTTNAWGTGLSNTVWKTASFKPTTLDYTGLNMTKAAASTLTLNAATLYNTEKYTAVATYTDANGEEQNVPIASGAATELVNIPFETNIITITIAQKDNGENKTEYTFQVTRPRDTVKTIANNGIVFIPDGRESWPDKYNGKTEGIMYVANEDGSFAQYQGVSSSRLYYRTYAMNALNAFSLTLKGSSAYTHIRFSTDDGVTWTYLGQTGASGLSTGKITIPQQEGSEHSVVKVMVQILDDKTYTENVAAEKDGFADSEPNTYSLWVEQIPELSADCDILTATVDNGDWYPSFDKSRTSYRIVVAPDAQAPTLTFTVSEGAKVTQAGEALTPDENGVYSVEVASGYANYVVSSSDGSTEKTYSFGYSNRASEAVPDKVTDYLLINGQYINGGGGAYGINPQQTLTGNGLLSLGNFGGYVTFYYENGLTDSANHPYGVDFYINGNAFKDTSTGSGLGSMEPGQVWVSENGTEWYALAGSEHYEDGTLWDYAVTYSKTETGGTAWKDNQGNTHLTTHGRSFAWPSANIYTMNDLPTRDSFTLNGILIPCVDGTITGKDVFNSYSNGARFGYVDTFINGTANPYLDNREYTNESTGFDLAWAVDGAGNPVDVSGKSFHYVKVVTASNIMAGAANEKSTEVGDVVRATAASQAVGVTAAPSGITFTSGGETYTVNLAENQQIYEVSLPNMSEITLLVNGTAQDDNIYINNQRVTSGTASAAFDIPADSHKLIRIIVQNGEKEPVIYLLKVTNQQTVAVTAITVNPESVELEAGKTAELTAQILPVDATDKSVTWTSSDETVATVENGVITGVKAGTATITVTTVDGGKTDFCEVTVKQPEQPEIPEGEATVYFSVSHDAEFLTTDTGKVMALQKVTVPYFDLTPYGLEDFSLPESHEGYGKPTMLHLYIYATEMFQYGVSPEEAGKGYLKDYIGSPMFACSGSPGSICMDQFWGMDMNLNYYHNYGFPADESGYGITADRVVLEDGDIVTIGHFTSWSFFGDSSSIFNYLVADGDTVETTAAQNDELNLQVYRAGPNLGTGGSNTPVEAERDICYVKAGELSSGDVTTWTKLGTTDATGKLAAGISDLPVGQYILAVAGQKGVEYPDDIVSTPGGMILNVTESTLSAAVQAVIAQIKAIGEVTLEKENAVTAARSAYDALSDAEKELVSNYDILEAAEKTLEELRQGQTAIQTVMDKIDAICDVTLDSATKIQEARDAYDALTEAQKELVTNYETLTAAEAALAVLKAAEADKEAARTVINLIEGIGEVTLESGEEIEAAREAYDALTEGQKVLVTNYEWLTEAEETLRLLKLGDADIANMYQTTDKYLSELEIPGVGSINGEWRVIGLARAGRSVPAAYYDAAVAYVKENIDADGRLHPAKSSDNSRLILALTSIGKDVTDVGGYDLLSGLDEMAYIGNQGLNGYIWALLAFDSHDYPIPSGDVSRDALVDAILTKQLSDGGWALAGTVSDPDMTGMALAALAPYQSEAPVAEAVEKALACLSNMQNADGTFSSVTEGTTCESLAQVVTGLTALGINPETDSRFVKNGVSAADAFAFFYVEAGGFRHGLTGQRNMMATEQGYYALASYYRLLEGKTALYDMSDVTIETSAANQEAANEVIGLINAIGTVDLTKEDEINAARAAYDALTDTQKALVTNYKTLTDAETVLAQLKQTAADTAAANEVKALIDAIGTVTSTGQADEIEAARRAYNALTTLQKNLVGAAYLNKLEAAEDALDALEKAEADEAAASAVEQKINNIGSNITLGSESKINTARNAYNALTADQKALVSNYQTLVNAEAVLNTLKSTVSVTFSLLGCYKHGTGETTVHTLASGNLQTWIAAKTYKVKPGATVKDLFEQALTAAGLTWKNPTGNYVESITRNGVTIGEFTNGTKSGWMYTLNGKHPGLGVAQQTLVNGDKVVFHYTDDYTKEEGNPSGSTTGTSSGTVSGSTNYITTTTTTVNTETAESVDRLIEDIGEEITLESEAKILAARAAYDKLTEAQKKLVEKYDDLVAAEAKLAELKGASGESENAYIVTGDYIQGLGTPGVGAIGGEWMVIGLARSGRPVPSGYYDHVLNYVRENINDAEQLHSAKSSDNSRLILALTAIGKDVTNVDGHDLLKGLNDMDYIQKQGINGPIWALLAFDSGNYPVPEGNVSRDKLIDVILDAQLSDGGWALSGEAADPDMTGMAIQALAPYMESNMDVKKAVEKAIWTLSKMQNDNGSFTSVDGPNSESIAQVIVALAALGIDADTDARFVKNGISALDALLTYYIPGGGFRHILDGNLDGMSTEQAFYALVAYERMKQNQNFLYDMTDVVDAGGDVIVEETTEPTEVPTEPAVEEEEDNGNNVVIWTGVMSICAAAIAVLLLNRKKLFGKF